MFKISDIKFQISKFPDIQILVIKIADITNPDIKSEKSKFLTLFAASTHVKMIVISKTNLKMPKLHTFFISMFIEKPICSVKA